MITEKQIKPAEYRVLARKYRPQRLSDLKGQEILSKSLQKAIEDQRIPHAFLFHGIRGVGKTTTARILAKALNCKGENGQGNITCEPCGKCSSCIAIQEDRHLDVIEIDAASHTGVDDMREVIDACRYKAVQGRYKVFIIDEVHMLSKSAFNALLKTLEEPPGHVKFIFATTELRKIPDTILSRCQRFDLKKMDQPLLIEYLSDIAKKEGFSCEPLALSTLARAADGSMRDGISLLDQAISLTQANNTTIIQNELVRTMLGQADKGLLLDLLENFFKGHIENGLQTIRQIISLGMDPILIMQDALSFIYGLTTYQTEKKVPDLGLSDQEHQRFKELAQQLSLSVLLQSWQIFMRGYDELIKSPLQNETLEMIFVRLCYVLPITTIDYKTQTQDDLKQTTTQVQNVKKKILTFDDLIQALQDAKEMALHTHCRHDVHLIHFQEGSLTLRLSEKCPKDIISKLKIFLEKETGILWHVQLSHEEGFETIVEKKQIALKNEETFLKEQPIAKKILQAFPDSKVTVMESTQTEE